ncbi:MAG: HNH endonuclease signature motif containing protein [Kangiellaceae bacterium]
MWLEAIRKPKDNEKKCPCCGGGVRRRSYGEMYAGSFISNGERMEIYLKPPEEFRDPIRINSHIYYFCKKLYKLWPSERYFAKGGSRLHRDVWEKAFGKIPEGCHIHHKDGNPENNKLSNLECMEASEHLRLTWQEKHSDREEYFNKDARAKAAEWHRSEEGRKWHREHALNTKSHTKWKRVLKPCDNCGEIVLMVVRKFNSQRFCGQICKSRYRRKNKNT